LRPHVKALSEIADTLIMIYPNAGLPNELGPMTRSRNHGGPGRRMGRGRPGQRAGRLLRLHARAHIGAMARKVA
jgi:hypothetical protein